MSAMYVIQICIITFLETAGFATPLTPIYSNNQCLAFFFEYSYLLHIQSSCRGHLWLIGFSNLCHKANNINSIFKHITVLFVAPAWVCSSILYGYCSSLEIHLTLCHHLCSKIHSKHMQNIASKLFNSLPLHYKVMLFPVL